MTLKVDKAGRIILPKFVRDRFNLREGSELALGENEQGLTLTPVKQRPSMVLHNGIWSHSGKPPRGFDWETMLDQDREERIKELAGL